MLKLFQNAKSLFRLCSNDHNTTTLYVCASNKAKRFCTSATTEEAKNSGPNVEEIAQGDAELQHKLKVLLLETEVMRQEGRNIPSPSFFKTSNWLELLKLRSRSARTKYLDFLFKMEKKKENEEIKKEQRRLEREQQAKAESKEPNDHLVYALGYNHIFLRIYETTMNDLYNWKLLEAMQFGQKLVVDCGFERQMTRRENLNCAKQLMLLFGENRAHDEPFDLHFCNTNPESLLMISLHQHIKTMYEPWFPLSLHEKSYTDIFPKEQLVYLTPHCKEELKTFDHDAVYILGGVVDKANNEPVSMAKAKEERLRMAKLPLDRYLQWGTGSGKSLTLNQMIAILLDMKRTGDWKYALRHVPRRKLFNADYANSQDVRSRVDLGWKPFRNDNLNLSYNRRRQEEREEIGKRRLRDVKSIFNE